MSLRDRIRHRVPLELLIRWRRFKARRLVARYRGEPAFSDEPVDLGRVTLFRRESFPDCGPEPWLDRADAEERIEKRLEAGEITPRQAEWCRQWHRDGYLVLERFHDAADLERIWEAVREAVESGRIPLTPDLMVEGGIYEGRLLDLHLLIPELREVLEHRPTIEILTLLLGREIRPFQTLAFFGGSEQLEHSDSIHMTTHPVGHLAATWTAVEDIDPDSGPLIYYPGSHRLPYLLSRDVGISPRESLLDPYTAYASKYEPAVQQLIRSEGLQAKIFTPRRGDVLVWHANLLHGGTARKDRSRSRKSIVSHYFARGAVCYHDLAAGLARLD